MRDDYFKGEWEFLKLLVGLNGASIGGWFFAQDRLVHSEVTALLFAATIVIFAVSMGCCLYSIRLLIDLEHGTIRTRVRSPDGGWTIDDKYIELIKRYTVRLYYSLGFFGLGYLQAAVLILISVRHRYLP